MARWRVTFSCELDEGDADNPVDAAKVIAEMLSEDDGVTALRASYLVENLDTKEPHLVDLDLPQNGGTGFYS